MRTLNYILVFFFCFALGSLVAQNNLNPFSKEYQQLKANGQIEQPKQTLYAVEHPDVNPDATTVGLLIPLDGTFTQAMGRNDDGYTSMMTLQFDFTFYGDMISNFYINNNGNISFGSPYSTYTATGFPVNGYPMLAPFWADVDTRNSSSGLVYYRSEPNRLVVIWDHVGYYNSRADKKNTFELIVTDGMDPLIGVGNNVAFCYGDMQWTTGSASGGSNGFGGVAATVGINKGNGVNYALIGRFDHEGYDFDGAGGSNDGVSYLDDKCFFFNTGVSFNNIPPVAQGTPAVQPIVLNVGDSYELSMTFLSPEADQTTNTVVTVPAGFPDFDYVVTPGNVCSIEIDVLATLNNVGQHQVKLVATDNGVPPESTTVLLNFQIINPAPVISIDPLTLSESLYPGETSTQTLTISNNGASDLTVDLEDIETSKRMKIKSVKPKSGSGDNSDDFMNYLNRRAAENAKSGKLVGWLAEAPLTGVIAPGASLEIEVAFDATELSADIYSAQILINSNDPATPQVVVPVTLEVMAVNCSYVVTNDNENNALAGIPDYDMDVYLFKFDNIAPIEFNIFVLDAVIDEAQLNLYAWDVDEIDGEIDHVYVNGTLVGSLTGADDEWSTSVFYLDPALITTGKNLIQVFIDVNTNGNWAVNVDWGQLIINNCMGGNAYIRYAETDNSMYPQGANVEVTVEVDTDLEQQNVIIETNLLDENNINVAGTSTTRTISLQADEPLTVSLAIPPTATLGANYHAQVIVYDATTYVQQDLALVPFFIWGGQGILNCLDAGWHLISSPYFAQDPDLDVLMAEVNASGALVIMLNKYGIYWPVSNINMLGDWNNHHGYKIKMAKAACIIWDGDEVMDKTVNLASGIDYLPVLSTEPTAAADVFSQIEGNLIYAFDIENGLIYWPNGGIFTLQMLNPGEAYLINMMSAGSVTYPFEKQAYQASPNKPQVINNAPYTVTKTGSAHFITIKAEALRNFSNGDIVAVFNTQGTCVGMAQYNGDKQPMVLAVYADDYTTEAIDGMSEGDVMQLAVYSPATLQQKILQPVWNTAMANTELFAENALSEVIDFKDALGVIDAAIDQIRIYPNPSTGIFTVTGANESVRLEILNTAGQQIQLLEANGSVQIDLSAHAKGIYYLRMISQQSTRIQKLVVE